MYDCWNIAYKYLSEKYKGKKILNSNKDRELRKIRLQKERKKFIDNLNELDYFYLIDDNKILNSGNYNDMTVLLYMKSYNYGIEAKKDLYFKLVSMNLI